MAVALGITAALLTAEAGAQTLEEAVRIAIGDHPTVKVAEANARAADETVNEKFSGWLPRLDLRAATASEHVNNPATRARNARSTGDNLSGNAAGNTGGQAGVNIWSNTGTMALTQNLFNGFATVHSVDAARQRAAVNRHLVLDARELIGLRVVEAYFSVLRARAVVQLSEANVRDHISVFEDIKAKSDAGGGDLADANQALSRLELARERAAALQGELRAAEIDFREAVGSMPKELSEPRVPTHMIPLDMQAAVEAAMIGNPAIRAAIGNVAASQADIKEARAPYLPILDLELAATREHGTGGVRGTSIEESAALVMRYNFFNGFADRARRMRAIERADGAAQSEAETRRLVEEQMRTDYNSMLTETERVPILVRRVRAAEDVVSAYRQQFELGTRTLLDVLDVVNELFQAKVAFVDGDTRHKIAQYQVMATMGVLLPPLGIAPPPDKEG